MSAARHDAATLAAAVDALRLTVIGPAAFEALLLDVAAGRSDELGVVQAVTEALQRARSAPTAFPLRCGGCSKPLTGPFAVAVAGEAHSDLPRRTWVICLDCGPDLASAERAAAADLGRVWPGWRPAPRIRGTVH